MFPQTVILKMYIGNTVNQLVEYLFQVFVVHAYIILELDPSGKKYIQIHRPMGEERSSTPKIINLELRSWLLNNRYTKNVPPVHSLRLIEHEDLMER